VAALEGHRERLGQQLGLGHGHGPVTLGTVDVVS
jgi:hypothetical protein